ncbi:2981_t:CDS:2, partial [Scutellospora calospora]
MLHLIICLLIVLLFSKIFEKALVANSYDIVLEIEDDDDHETGKDSVVDDILDELISFVRENNEKLECLACNDAIKVEKDEEVASLVQELTELVQEQQEKIDKQF